MIHGIEGNYQQFDLIPCEINEQMTHGGLVTWWNFFNLLSGVDSGVKSLDTCQKGNT